MKGILFLALLSMSFASYAKEPSSDSIYNLRSAWIDGSNRKVALETFRGHPVLLAMFYTSCNSACPLIAENMKRVEKALPADLREKTRFVLVSFDSEEETPEHLREFSQEHGLSSPHWSVLEGNSGAVRELAAVLGVQYKRNPSGGFAHSNAITYIDPDGKIRYQKTGLDPSSEEIVRAMTSTGRTE